jgi:hypothetical protein
MEVFRKVSSKNPKIRFLSLILQNEEKKCLYFLDSFLDLKGRILDTYIHDGALVRKQYYLNGDETKKELHRQQTTAMKNGQHDFTHLKFEPGFLVDLLRLSEAFIKEKLGINITFIARILDQPSGVSHMKKLMNMMESYK